MRNFCDVFDHSWEGLGVRGSRIGMRNFGHVLDHRREGLAVHRSLHFLTSVSGDIYLIVHEV